MRIARPLGITVAFVLIVGIAGCGVVGAPTPAPPPTVADATVFLERLIDAGIARDFDRLCGMATGTCDGELQGHEQRAPLERPTVVDASVHQPIVSGDGYTAGGVLFVLCGVDAAGDPYESEVLVSRDRDTLIATAAVYWVGTGVVFAAPDEGVATGEATPGPGRC